MIKTFKRKDLKMKNLNQKYDMQKKIMMGNHDRKNSK